VEVHPEDGTTIILDAGTGIRALGLKLESEPCTEIHILLSHLHLDHLVGLGFFLPLFTKGFDIHVWGPRSPLDTLGERITRYLSPPLFPVHLSQAPSLVKLHDVPAVAWQLGAARVTAQPVSHNGPTLGYRIEENGRSLAYIPDHEPALGGDLSRVELEWISGYGLAARANVLLHDAQYTAEEYAERIGWGHSSIAHVVRLAQRAAVERLVLFHHDPMHTDTDLEEILQEARRLWGPAGNAPMLAYEGMQLDLTADEQFDPRHGEPRSA
jgi:ribonuclease BN (tRNA processing enzyme)